MFPKPSLLFLRWICKYLVKQVLIFHWTRKSLLLLSLISAPPDHWAQWVMLKVAFNNVFLSKLYIVVYANNRFRFISFMNYFYLRNLLKIFKYSSIPLFFAKINIIKPTRQFLNSFSKNFKSIHSFFILFYCDIMLSVWD